MNSNKIFLMFSFLLVGAAAVCALSVQADYVTIYPGEEGKIEIEVDNTENFDIEDVSVAIDLGDLPFTSVGSSEKDIDDLDEDNDDSATFTIRASADIKPGDYEIPYEIKYTNSDTDETDKKTGSFGLRVGAKTDLDFSLDIDETPINGEKGTISIEIINKGLGEIKSVTVQITPEGFELLSNEKVFVGSVDSDDTETAQFDVIYRSNTPSLRAKVEYKDFENAEQTKLITIPFKVYSEEEAIRLGLKTKSNTGFYVGLIVLIIVVWFIWRRIKKKRKNNNKNKTI